MGYKCGTEKGPGGVEFETLLTKVLTIYKRHMHFTVVTIVFDKLSKYVETCETSAAL